jgi:hypothetical protein
MKSSAKILHAEFFTPGNPLLTAVDYIEGKTRFVIVSPFCCPIEPEVYKIQRAS